MAFAIRNLSVLAYANGFTLWHYKAGTDDQRSIGSPGYFKRRRRRADGRRHGVGLRRG
ncbi:MAG: hypothetical protein WDN04_16885 [Rhodospirillales bacterium]